MYLADFHDLYQCQKRDAIEVLTLICREFSRRWRFNEVADRNIVTKDTI